jgi:hypothetical protein
MDLGICKEKLENLYKQKDHLLTQDSNLMRALQDTNNERDKSSARLQEIKIQENSLKDQKITLQREITDLQNTQENYQKSLTGIEENISVTKAEMSRSEIGELTNPETKELENLIKEVQDYEEQHKKVLEFQNKTRKRNARIRAKVQIFLARKRKKTRRVYK